MLLFAWPAGAQRLLVVTNALSTVRESGALYLQSARLHDKAILPGPVLLAGDQLDTAPVPFSRDKGYFISTRAPSGLSTLTRICGVPFNAYRQQVPLASPGAENSLLRVLTHTANGDPMPVLLEKSPGGGSLVAGRFEGTEAWRGVFHEEVRWPLGTGLLDSAFQGNSNLTLFLMQGQGGGYEVFGGDVYWDQEPRLMLEITPELASIQGGRGQFASTENGVYVYVLISGFDVEANLPEAVTDVYCIDTRIWELQGGKLRVRGHPAETGGIAFDSEGNCWLATRQLGTGFGLAAQIALAAGEDGARALYKIREYVVPGILEHFIIAPDPVSSTVAVAAGSRVEIWPEGSRENVEARFTGEVELLQWVEGLPVAAVENTLHVLSPADAQPLNSLSFQTGWVRSVAVIPAEKAPGDDSDGDGLGAQAERSAGTRPDSMDSDGDGIHDGIDPEPLQASPRLELPSEICFRPEALGKELRAIGIDSHGDTATRWSIDYDREAMPWLITHPRAGAGSGYTYLGIDPSYYEGRATLAGTVTVSMIKHTGERIRQAPCFGSPSPIAVWIPPASQYPGSILWLWPERDRQGANGLTQMLPQLQARLARAPQAFNHTNETGPAREALANYRVVVLTAEAAASGAVLQQDLIAYLRKGGGVLFLGGEVKAPFAPLVSQFFSSLFIAFDGAAGLSGAFPAPEGADTLLRNWPAQKIREGAAILHEGPAVTVPADGPGRHVFLAREFGYGRLALLATPALVDPAQPGKARWIEDLFYWLSNAGSQAVDMDGDGLPNAVEDPNRNGSVDLTGSGVVDLKGHVDPGETNWLQPDTDRDGLPDGLEDRNQNGRVDEGETDPRNVDTDGDGTFDGADSTAFAAFGSPHIDGVSPAECPLEGGLDLTISGRNLGAVQSLAINGFMVNIAARFSTAQITVTSPALPDGAEGPADIEALDVQGERIGRFPGLFAYRPRSTVALRAVRAGWPVRVTTYFEGLIDVYLDVPDGVKLGPVAIQLHPSLPDAQWREPQAGAALRGDPANLDWEAQPGGDLVLRFSGASLAERGGQVAQLYWHLPRGSSPHKELTFTFEDSNVLAPHRQPLAIKSAPYTVILEATP